MSKVKLENIYLFDYNPRYTLVNESKDELNKIDRIDKNININSAKKIMANEGRFDDLKDLMESIVDRGYKEESNPFILYKIKENYLVTDGNRRLLTILLLKGEIEIDAIIADEVKLDTKALSNITSIKQTIDEFKPFIDTLPNSFEFSKIFDAGEVDEMFDEINFRHTGIGNGKRIWPRGKMLKEIYIIYNDVNLTHEQCIDKIVKTQGVTKRKAKSDIVPAILVNELIDKYNELNEKQIDINSIAPSSLELVRSTKFSKRIIEHPENKNESTNIRELFNINISKIDNKYKFFVDDLKIISFDILAKLLISGFSESNNFTELHEYVSEKLEDEFEGNWEKENNENSGLKKNVHYSTRSWSKQGEDLLLDILDWPKGNTIQMKVSSITEDRKKIFNLKISELEQVLNEIINVPNLDSRILDILQKRLAFENANCNSSENQDSVIESSNNHIFTVLNKIYNGEFNKLKLTDSEKAFPITEKNVVSQLAVLRTMYELLEILFINISISYLGKLTNETWTNVVLSENFPIPELKESTNLNDQDKKEKWMRLHKQLILKKSFGDISVVFKEILKYCGAKIKAISLTKLFDFVLEMVNEEEEEHIKMKSSLIKFKEISCWLEEALSHKNIGEKVSLPMHHIHKFINENDLETLLEYSIHFLEMKEKFSKIYNALKENVDFLYKDDEFKDYIKI